MTSVMRPKLLHKKIKINYETQLSINLILKDKIKKKNLDKLELTHDLELET